ncbi:hypothetical protein TNCV_4597771 [Trichonephila clavipes]|nr:hypothetical protein TNCV_4597771 [Trichonephila clavipes]
MEWRLFFLQGRSPCRSSLAATSKRFNPLRSNGLRNIIGLPPDWSRTHVCVGGKEGSTQDEITRFKDILDTRNQTAYFTTAKIPLSDSFPGRRGWPPNYDLSPSSPQKSASLRELALFKAPREEKYG